LDPTFVDATVTLKNRRSGTPLWFAAWGVAQGEKGWLELAKLLVEQGADVNAIGKEELCGESTPLYLATMAVRDGEAKSGLVLAKLLVKYGANVNVVGQGSQCVESSTPLCLATMTMANGDDEADAGLELAKLFVEKGADVNFVGVEHGGETQCTQLDLSGYCSR
jgi:ankyrin repeat protein